VHDGGIALQHHAPAICRDFEARRTRRLARSGYHQRRHAGGKVEVRRHVVLDLDLVKASEAADSERAPRRAEEPDQRIEQVRRLIDEQAPSFAQKAAAPGALGVIGFGAEKVGGLPDHALDAAELAALEQRLQPAKSGIGAVIVHHAEQRALGCRDARVDREHLVANAAVHAERLLDQNVATGEQRLLGEREVRQVRRGDDDGVDPGQRRELGRANGRDGKRRAALAVEVGHGGQAGAWNGALCQRASVSSAGVADPDDADT
jgi:hypothetical protein